MGKSNKLIKAFVSGVKSFKSPSKDKAEKDRSSSKGDEDQRKGGKEKCLWSLGKSFSRSRDSLSAVAAFLDTPEVKSVQDERLAVKNANSTHGSHASGYIDASRSLNNIHDRSIPGYGTLLCTEGSVQEELAAVRIQSAIRRYLATKRMARVLRALVRIQALWRGQRVRRQSAAALRCMQALIKVQALARGHRVRSSELGQLIQKHIQQTRQQKKRPTEGWVSSMATLEQLQAKAQSKQDAVMKRQRALVYAFSEQLNRCPSKQISLSSVDYQPDKSYWGWAWLERWMAAQQVGISSNAAKGQHSKFKLVKNKSNAELDAEEHESGLIPSKGVGGDNHFTSSAGDKDVHAVVDDTTCGNDGVEQKETVNNAVGKTLDQLKCRQGGLQYPMPMADVVKRSVPSLSPPAPPPPPPRVTAKLVAEPSSFPSSQTPTLNAGPSSPSEVYTIGAHRAVSSAPPPPPPPPPFVKRVKPFVIQERSSSDSRQLTSSLPTTGSQTTKVPHSYVSCANHLSGGGKSSDDVMLPFTAAVSPIGDPPSSMSATLVASSSLPDGPFPVPNVPESCGDPLLKATSPSPIALSNASRTSMLMQDQCDSATYKSGTLSPTMSRSSPHSSFSIFPEMSAQSPEQHVTYQTPVVIPHVTDEEMPDPAAETGSVHVKDDFRETNVIEADAVKNAENGIAVDTKTDITDQDEIDMDVDYPEAANVLQHNVTTQSNALTEQNGWDDLMKTGSHGKPMEVSTNKPATNSRQGQLTEATSPSLPNYMTATKSAKAKIRSPSQKVESPKQPRFDTSRAKFESPKQKNNSPKQRQDVSKQKVASPGDKADSGANRRHSLSTPEGKLSAGATKLVTGARATSKGQSGPTRVSKSIDEFPSKSTEELHCNNGY